MSLQLIVFLLPVVVFFLLFTQHLYGLMRDTQAPIVFTTFAVVLAAIVTGVVGFIYYIVTQFVIFGYVDNASFNLEPLPSVSHTGPAYLGNTSNDQFPFVYFHVADSTVVGRIPTADTIIVERDGPPVAVCERYATHFPEQFNGGDFLDPSDAASCVFNVPSGSVVEKYLPPKE